MNKTNVTNVIKGVRKAAAKHSPEILIGIGLAGMITTTVLAVKATPKALWLLEEKKNELDTDDLTVLETVKTTWKCYIPAVTTGVCSAACIIGAGTVNAKRNAALATAYKLSEAAFVDYKEKVVETIGEKKEKTVKSKIAKSKVENNPVTKRDVIITGKGETLCYDISAGQYFKSDIESIKKSVNELNRQMTYDMYISWNEFLSELGMKSTPMGDQLGWNLDDGLIELEYDSQIADDGTPCITIEYLVGPKYDFSKLS